GPAARLNAAPLHEAALGPPPFDHVRGHRRPPVASRACLRREHRVQLGVDVGPPGLRPLLGLPAVELRDSVAELQPYRGGLLRDADGDLAATGLTRDLHAAE